MPDDEKEDCLIALRSLDPAIGLSYYNKWSLGGPTKPDKVLVRMHLERSNHPDLTEEERQVSIDWLNARKMARRVS